MGGDRAWAGSDSAAVDYYGIPAIHKPHWKWLIINYFFLGGISSTSYVIAAIAGLSNAPENREISRIGHYVSLAALAPCPVLLILDLGRPERFLNMVKTFNPRSPMSLGTWGVATFSVFSSSSALVQAAQDGLAGRTMKDRMQDSTGRSMALVGTAPAFFVGGYTGVLLGATAVPLWAKSANLLGPLFLSSALSSASSAISLVLAFSSENEDALDRIEAIERTAIGAKACLLAAASVRLGSTGRPLRERQLGTIMKVGVVGLGIATPLAIQLVNRKRKSRSLTVVGSIASLAGSFALRYVVVMAGHASADDPQATFEFAR